MVARSSKYRVIDRGTKWLFEDLVHTIRWRLQAYSTTFDISQTPCWKIRIATNTPSQTHLSQLRRSFAQWIGKSFLLRIHVLQRTRVLTVGCCRKFRNTPTQQQRWPDCRTNRWTCAKVDILRWSESVAMTGTMLLTRSRTNLSNDIGLRTKPSISRFESLCINGWFWRNHTILFQRRII